MPVWPSAYPSDLRWTSSPTAVPTTNNLASRAGLVLVPSTPSVTSGLSTSGNYDKLTPHAGGIGTDECRSSTSSWQICLLLRTGVSLLLHLGKRAKQRRWPLSGQRQQLVLIAGMSSSADGDQAPTALSCCLEA